MREEKFNFNFKATAASGSIASSTTGNSKVFDLAAQLKRPEVKQAAPKPQTENADKEAAKPEPEQTPGNEGAAPAGNAGSAKLSETVEKTKAVIEKELANAITDPKRASKNVLKFFNMIRLVFYPWLYKKIIFEGPELAALDPMLKKIADAKAASKTPELNPLEVEMQKKWDFYQKQKLQIPWTEDEINDATEAAYMKLAEIKVMRWLLENEWAIVFLVMEGKRLGPVVAHRAGFGEISL